MKVVIATPILYDTTSPFNHLFKDIIGGFLDAGYEIERHVAVKDSTDNEYTCGYNNIKYIRYKRKESAHNNIITRYIRDTITNMREARGIKKSKADVLFEDVSYSSYWAVRAAKKKGMRIVVMLQDVWPDNAVQSGLIKQNGVLYKFFEFWQRYVYKKADKIICISDDMKDFVASKGICQSKIEVIYNWGYRDDPVDISWENNSFVKKYGLKKEFYAVYAGNIGKMQNVELVVRAARKMPDTRFLIIGDGARRQVIEEMAAGADNITLFPLQPTNFAEHIYSMAGVNIVPLVTGGQRTAMPSKTAIILSCGNPVVFCFDMNGKLRKLIDENNAGFCVSAIDEKELVQAIEVCKKQSLRDEERIVYKTLFLRTKNIEHYVKTVGNVI